MDFVKAYLANELRQIRVALLGKVEGVSEYELRRPRTATGTNLLGLINHLAIWEARYLGEVFERPFPEPLLHWDAYDGFRDDLWVTADITSEEVIARFRRVGEHSDETIQALDLEAAGHVPWWPKPDVMLFNVLVHLVVEANRHAGHADILREQIDVPKGVGPMVRDAGFWDGRYAEIEAAAKAAADREIGA